jgi:lysophospholipase L1-like esterase
MREHITTNTTTSLRHAASTVEIDRTRHALQQRAWHRWGFLFAAAVALLMALCHIARAQQTAAPEAARPRLFVVGDSTARNNANGARGWGDPFVAYLDAAKIDVQNRARAGRSSRTFITEGLWDAVVADIRPGDTVLIQMGHNDGGPIDSGRFRASLPGIGEETKEITRTDGAKETVHTYGWYLRKMIADAKAKGVTPLVLSLTVRNLWKDGKVERGNGAYGRWAKEVAAAQDVAFLDLTAIIADRYDALGQEAVKAMFGPDYVHTSPAGAELNAASVVAGLKAAKHPLTAFLSEKGAAVEAYKPAVTAAS